MLENIAQFTAWPIITGIIIGYVANRIMSGEGKGCCLNLIVGIAGSYAGTFISSLVNVNLFGAGYLKKVQLGGRRESQLHILCPLLSCRIMVMEEAI